VNEPVQTPVCPLCGEPPVMVLTSQSFCGNEGCRVFVWNQYEGLDQLDDAQVIDLPIVDPPPDR
jgi:hypothetical protein